MPRKLIKNPAQTVEYYALWGLESGLHQVSHIVLGLKKEGIELNTRQVSGALQRLTKIKQVRFKGRWDKVTN